MEDKFMKSRFMIKNVKSAIQSGFSLLELVFGIALMAVVLLLMTGALFPQLEKSTDPWLQVRSAELAQSMMNEILARRYDENNLVIGNLRCGETGAGACATQGQLDSCLTTEEVSRDLFDDVDDFNCLDTTGADVITNIEDTNLAAVYNSFNVQVTVALAPAQTFKIITVTVTPPRGTPVVYSSVKGLY